MVLTPATYTQAASLQFQDATISPATVADGTLRQRFDPRAFPRVGHKATGKLGAQLPAPVLTKGTTGTTGGTFAAGTYFWKVTAINKYGETIGSNEVTATLVLNGTQALSWAAVPGATGYKVYRGTVTNTENVRIATLGQVTSYTDTGTAGSAATVPGTNTTDEDVPAAARTTHGAGS